MIVLKIIKRILSLLAAVLAVVALTVPAFALEYSAAPSEGYNFVHSPGFTIVTEVFNYGNITPGQINVGYFIDPLFPVDDVDPSLLTTQEHGTFTYGFDEIASYSLTYDNYVADLSASEYRCDFLLESNLLNNINEATGFVYMIAEDFYCWEDEGDYDTTSELVWWFNSSWDGTDPVDHHVNILSASVTYSFLGDTYYYFHEFTQDQLSEFQKHPWTELIFDLSPSDFLLNATPDTVCFIEELRVEFDYPYDSYPANFEVFGQIDYTERSDLRSLDVGAHIPSGSNPAVPLRGYTDWLGTAASGFLNLQIFPGFTLSGLFMTVVAFSCVIWFLKLVAGG